MKNSGLENVTLVNAAPAKRRGRFLQFGCQNFLYRILGWGVILAVFGSGVVVTAQRRERPPIEPPEKPKTKKVKGPRAVGLLRLESGGKATLIPIAILTDGKFYDAGAYKADPVPMALDVGTVYEAERSGDSQGLFTVNGALHSKSANSENPWVGSGAYLANGTEKPNKAHKAEDVPVGMENDSGPPRLTKADKAKPPEPENAPADAKAANGSADKPAATASAPATTDGKPTNPPAQSTAPPTLAKPADQTTPPATKDQTAGKQPDSASSADSYRPTLRRGKPTQPLPDDDETTTKPAVTKSPDAKTTDDKTPAPSSKTVELIPAISDAGGPDPKSYKFEWRKGEEDDRRKQMLALASDEFGAYLKKQAQSMITANTETGAKSATKSSSSAHKPAGKPAQPALENIQFKSFDVWDNNDPVMVLTAEASAPPPSANGAAAEPLRFNITLVARTDIYSNLHKLYVGITDKYHLDLTPRLELIDAVDVDGDGRGELLFHETTDAGSGYVIYRATADTLWPLFDSLHPE